MNSIATLSLNWCMRSPTIQRKQHKGRTENQEGNMDTKFWTSENRGTFEGPLIYGDDLTWSFLLFLGFRIKFSVYVLLLTGALPLPISSLLIWWWSCPRPEARNVRTWQCKVLLTPLAPNTISCPQVYREQESFCNDQKHQKTPCGISEEKPKTGFPHQVQKLILMELSSHFCPQQICNCLTQILV